MFVQSIYSTEKLHNTGIFFNNFWYCRIWNINMKRIWNIKSINVYNKNNIQDNKFNQSKNYYNII